MPAFIDLRPGMHVHVMPTAGSLANAYETVIREIDDAGVRVEVVAHAGDVPAEIVPNEELTLFVRVGGRIYRLESRARFVEHMPELTIVLEHPTEADRSERRQFYRLLATIAPRYAARTNAEGDELERFDVRILDISGGGLQLQLSRWVPVGSRIRLIFELDDDPMEIDASVVALSVVRSVPRRALYRVHCRFVDLPRSERERIVRFVFRKQIDFRKRGVA